MDGKTGAMVGFLLLVKSNMLLLRNDRKVYEAKVYLYNCLDSEKQEIEVYRCIQTDPYFDRFDTIIESVHKVDEERMRAHDKLGFKKTDIITKTSIYYRIK